MAYAPVQETLAPLQSNSPETVERYRKLAALLLAQANSEKPVEHWAEGVGRLAEALMSGVNEQRANKLESEGEAQAWQAIMGGLDAGVFGGGGGGGEYGGGEVTGGETADVPGAEPVAATGDDADMIIRTVIGEAAGEPPEGQQAVASVILNRARQAGMTPSQVVLAKNQFEPWGSRASQLRAIDPNSEQYRRIAANVLPVLQGQASDPTGGATHFYAPRAQAALGRSTPSWARGPGQDIGNHRFYSLGYPGGGRHGTETAAIPGAEPVGSAPSPEVMAHITGGGATPAGMAFAPPAAPPPAPVASVPPPTPIVGQDAPVAGPPMPPQHPLARVPQPRPEPAAVAAPAPAVTGSVAPAAPVAPRPVPMPPVKNDYATVPGRRPSVAPVRPGQLMQEPYSGPMSAQEFARQGQAAMRARAAGQQPAMAPTTGQPQQPRRNLLQALLGRGGPQGPASPPAAPAPSAAPAGGAVAPVDGRRAQIAALLSNPRVPDALKLAALKSLTPQERDPFTLGPGQVRYDPAGNPIAAVPATPEKREKTTDANGIPRWVDTGEPVFPADTTGGKAPPKITDVAAMRKELHGLDTYKRYAKAAPVFNSLSESFGKNTRAGDLDFVYAMATIFDPESVVREGEQILVRNTANLPDQVVNGISSLMSGTGQLDGETRRNLYDVVHGRMKQYREAADTELAGFPEMAGRWGINPADIMPNLMELKTLPDDAPAVGATFTEDEIARIPEGAVVEDDETHQRFRKRGGVLVPEPTP